MNSSSLEMCVFGSGGYSPAFHKTGLGTDHIPVNVALLLNKLIITQAFLRFLRLSSANLTVPIIRNFEPITDDIQ